MNGEEFLSHPDAARYNRNSVLRFIMKNGPVSRTDIWNAMSISRASVTQIIRQLSAEKLIVEKGMRRAQDGRQTRGLMIDSGGRWMYLFDWNCGLLCRVNWDGKIREQVHLNIPERCTPFVLQERILAGLDALERDDTPDMERFLGLGIALPGIVDYRTHTVLYSVELGWRDVDVRALFRHRFGDSVYLERTGNMLALGEEYYGCAKDYDSVLLVMLDFKGIGASSVVHGECQHGSNSMFGELGHIKLPSDVICSCGQKGCLEAVVNHHMLHNGNCLDDKLQEYLALGISTAINLYDPSIILLTGGLLRGLMPEEKAGFISRLRSKITNERSRMLKIEFCEEDTLMGIKGLSVYLFGQHYNGLGAR